MPETRAPSSTTFRGRLERFGKTATGIRVPKEIIETLGQGKRPAVVVRLKAYEFRTTIGVMRGLSLIPVSSTIRSSANVSAGDELTVTLAADLAHKAMALPDDLVAALARDVAAMKFYESLSGGYQRAFVTWIESAKTPGTRADRVAKTAKALSEGRKVH